MRKLRIIYEREQIFRFSETRREILVHRLRNTVCPDCTVSGRLCQSRGLIRVSFRDTGYLDKN